MKIAVWHNLPSGGGKRALYYHIKGLIERGHIVESWCPPTADQTYLPLSALVRENVVPMGGIGVRWKEPFRRAKKVFDLFNRQKALDKHCQICAKQINSGGFDLLFANSSLNTCTSPIGYYVKCPKILYLQEPQRRLYEAIPKLPWVALNAPKTMLEVPTYILNRIEDAAIIRCRRYQAREELLNAQSFDRILVNSLYSRESILRAYGLDARVCYLGVDTELFVPRDRKKNNIIVSVGSIRYEKNTKFIVESVALVKKNRPKLVLIANNCIEVYRQEVIALAKYKGVELEIKENISDIDLIDILNTSQMLVYAPRLEPFGFAPLEAGACGIPVVAVAEGGVRETVINNLNGIIVEPDPKEMAHWIERLIENRDLANKLGRQGRDLAVNKWPLKIACDNLEKQLYEILNKRSTLVSHR